MGGLVDELAADLVDGAVGPELLTYPNLCLGTKGPAAALANLDFVDENLDLPALGVEGELSSAIN